MRDDIALKSTVAPTDLDRGFEASVAGTGRWVDAIRRPEGDHHAAHHLASARSEPVPGR